MHATRWVYLFPGQGSQQVGMGKALAADDVTARRTFEEADEALGFSLSSLCFEGPEDELTRTANQQPAILACSIAAMRVVEARFGLTPTCTMGHSLGEWSALVAAGALTFADAVRLVHLRGRAMQEAVPEGQGAMAALLGLDIGVVEEVCRDAAEAQIVAPANENGGGQIVIAGHAAAIARASDLARTRGGKVIPLKVSAPFHCALMSPAAIRVRDALVDIAMRPMRSPVISNVDAEASDDPERARRNLVEQVTSRVRWDASVRNALRIGVDAGIELGHGKVLAGLCKRIDKALRVVSVGSPADLDVLKVQAP
jgi:[acyl-carrier-protein] S-malonyltransferase